MLTILLIIIFVYRQFFETFIIYLSTPVLQHNRNIYTNVATISVFKLCNLPKIKTTLTIITNNQNPPPLTMNLTSSARVGRAQHVAWSPSNQPDTILLLGGWGGAAEKTVEVISG